MRTGGTLRLMLRFPSRYADHVALVLQTAGGFAVPFTEIPASVAADEGVDVYALEIPLPAANRQFYRFRLVLR